MPVSLSNSRVIHGALKKCGVNLVSAMPETWLVPLLRMIEDDQEMTLLRLAKEEEGVGISAGAYFAGIRSAILMQNHGFLASINGVVSLALLYKIPLLLLISYRGHFGDRDSWQAHGGMVTEPMLRGLSIPYELVNSPAEVEKSMAAALAWTGSSLHPVALLLTRKLMWED
ncbi:MAG TPA: sulfopyruvate decarboxylase [Candidatus Angelobacter sp.]